MDFTGQTIGQYQIEEKLDNDNPGMSEVYRAYNPVLDRQVVIKILSPTLARDTTFVQRFRQEARALARLKHDHIVSVYDAGHYAQFEYLVMEYIPGGSVAGLLRREGALPLERAVTIVKQIASALDYAHEAPRGMVHRDIKPANILIDADGSAKLTDFGLVKLSEVSLTIVGQRFGTPAYMAPEQVLPMQSGGSMSGVGPWTDVYALGMVGYHMLTNRLPFRGSVQQLLDAQVRHSAPSMRSFQPEIPQAVDDVILKAINKKPEDRYPSAGAFAAALEQAANVSTRSPSINPFSTVIVEAIHRPDQDATVASTVPSPTLPPHNGVTKTEPPARSTTDSQAQSQWSRSAPPPVQPLPPVAETGPLPAGNPFASSGTSGAATLQPSQRNRMLPFIIIGAVLFLIFLALLFGLLFAWRGRSASSSPTATVAAAIADEPTTVVRPTSRPSPSAEPTGISQTPSVVAASTPSPSVAAAVINNVTTTSVFTGDLPIRLIVAGTNLSSITSAELVGPNQGSIPLEIEQTQGPTMTLVLATLSEPVVGAATYGLRINGEIQPGTTITLQDYSERKTAQGILDTYTYTNRVGTDPMSAYTRLRTQPDSNSEAVGTLRNGDQVDILRTEGDWYQLRIAVAGDPTQNGVVGWLERWLIDNQGVPAPPPTAVPPPTRIPAISFGVRVDVNYEGSGNSGQFTSCISGKVLGPGGRPYAGAQVNVNNGPSNSYSGRTNANGIYSICGLGASYWSVVLQSVPGQQLARQAVGQAYVNGGAQDAIVNFSQR